MDIERVHFGYWYPMTTLHLAEVYDFLRHGQTPLHLSKPKLHQLHKALGIKTVELKIDVLEYLEITAGDDIVIKIYEDGLVTLSDKYKGFSKDIHELYAYFKEKFAPLIYYLFSTGAPIPKDLAGIDNEFPCFIVGNKITPVQAHRILMDLGAEPYFEIKSKGVDIFRGGDYYVISVTNRKQLGDIQDLIENLIYFKEFKSQLHHYLNMHRLVWEEIEDIKEERSVRGRNIKKERTRLESYRKTIELIEGRINQMDLYVETRSNLANEGSWAAHLHDILEFRFDNLEHSHDYVRSLWTMTRQQVDAAIEMFSEINAMSTKTSVQALTIISSLGVVNGVINYLSLAKLPQVNGLGVSYFLILLVGTLVLNQAIVMIYGSLRYKVNAVEINHRIGAQRK